MCHLDDSRTGPEKMAENLSSGPGKAIGEKGGCRLAKTDGGSAVTTL